MKAELIGEVYEYQELVEAISSTEEPIELLVNSPGGDVFSGLQIVNAVQKHGNVTANVEVMSASIAAVVTLSCKHFTIGKNDLMILHNCWTFAIGNKEELRQEAETMEKIDAILHNIILEHCNEPDKIEAMMNEGDVFLTGEEVADLFDNCELIERGKQDRYAASAMPSIIKALKDKESVKEEPQASLTIEEFNKGLADLKAEIIEACKPKEEPYVMSCELKELMNFND